MPCDVMGGHGHGGTGAYNVIIGQPEVCGLQGTEWRREPFLFLDWVGLVVDPAYQGAWFVFYCCSTEQDRGWW